MKYITLFFLTLNFQILFAQCAYKGSVPDELYRGRYKPADMVYGNPYTMFNKSKPGGVMKTIATISCKPLS